MYNHVCRHVCVDMCIDTCIDICIDMCVDTCIDTCIHMCIGICLCLPGQHTSTLARCMLTCAHAYDTSTPTCLRRWSAYHGDRESDLAGSCV